MDAQGGDMLEDTITGDILADPPAVIMDFRAIESAFEKMRK